MGFSRQTIYIYISILRLINRYPNYFPKQKAIDFGQKKMRFITEGVSTIDKKISNEKIRKKAIVQIFNSISPKMPSTEIEVRIEEIIDEY